MIRLKKALSEMEIAYTEDDIQKLKQYMELILEWNEKVNLTAITDKDEFIKRHYIDSVAICAFSQMKQAKKIIDVGTGAGFPGIPLAILYPEKEFLLMDSTNKKIKIVEELAAKIGLSNVSFAHGRAEDLAQDKKYREQFDLCVSRAVANLAVLSEYCLPFLSVGGWFAPYKSEAIDEEIKNSLRAIELLGGKLDDTRPIKLSGYNLEHKILFIKKVKKTLSKYPRKAGTPLKEPLR